MIPDASLTERFSTELEKLLARGDRLGVAVSGGPDSLALLLLAAAARPGEVEAATVDHGLRPESRAEAEMVARLCQQMGVPHATLDVRWRDRPETAIQERARRERYRLLGYWAEERGLGAVATGHHADDQAETFLMRLMRGAGVRGLAGMRPRSIAAGSEVRLIRPLLSCRRRELERFCTDAGVAAVEDPSNQDERFERVRLRKALAASNWLDPAAIALSASHLADAETALEWAARIAWREAVRERPGALLFHANDVPAEISRRIVSRAIRRLATEGEDELRGAEIDHLLKTLALGGTATLRGVQCTGGADWRFAKASPRRL